jgi:hypothetical protein
MLVVAATGIALGAIPWGRHMLRLRSDYLAKAASFAQEEAAYRKLAASLPSGLPQRFTLKQASMMRNWRLYYERLARYPWLPDDAGSPDRLTHP